MWSLASMCPKAFGRLMNSQQCNVGILEVVLLDSSQSKYVSSSPRLHWTCQ